MTEERLYEALRAVSVAAALVALPAYGLVRLALWWWRWR